MQHQQQNNMYIGSFKSQQNQYGGYLMCGLNRDDLNKLMQNMGENDWVNFTISRREKPSEYGHTHTGKILPPLT